MFLLRPDIFPWDLAILLFIAVGFCVAVAAFRFMGHTRRTGRKILLFLLGLLFGTGCALTLYGSFIEPQTIVVDTFSVPFPTEEPLTIAVVSDIHLGPYKSAAFAERLVRTVNRQNPDIILLPGDFLMNNAYDSPALLRPLGALRANLGVYAVLGNHESGQYGSLLSGPFNGVDRADDIAEVLETLGISVIRNEYVHVETMMDTFIIAGVDDEWSGADPAKALADIPPDMPVILLAHNPDTALTKSARRAQLIVSGHTHGGQFRLPFIGPIAPIPTKLGRAYDQGIFKAGNTTALAITRGAGETLARGRLFAWPQVMILKTTSTQQAGE